MDEVVMENIFLLVLVTLLSVVQNAFFAQKVEKECKTHDGKKPAIERLSCAKIKLQRVDLVGDNVFAGCVYNKFRNCMDAYPTFLAVMWCAGICLSQAPAAFAGVMYLVARQKYFVGYMGQTCQSTPGFLFGKRVLFFLSLMCVVGIVNYLLVTYLGSDYKEYIQTITKAASTLLLIP